MRADLRGYDYARHTHDGFVIAMTESGGSRVFSRGVSEAMDAGVLFVSNPAEVQASWMGGAARWQHRSFYLDAAGIAEIAQALELRDPPGFIQSFNSDRDLIASLLSLHLLFEGRTDAFREREAFVQTFAELFRRYGSGRKRIAPAPRDRVLLERAVGLIQERFAEPLHLEWIAAGLELSPFQLIGLFKRGMGITPHAYLTQVRLDAARDLLRRGHSIAATAVECGFYDQSALTRNFRRCYAMTPRQFILSSHT
jgi:AraC-like DNA-binding protein